MSLYLFRLTICTIPNVPTITLITHLLDSRDGSWKVSHHQQRIKKVYEFHQSIEEIQYTGATIKSCCDRVGGSYSKTGSFPTCRKYQSPMCDALSQVPAKAHIVGSAMSLSFAPDCS